MKNNNQNQSNITYWETNEFPWTNEAKNILYSTFKLKEFRSLQLSVINSVLSGKDCLVIMSTGGGKSLCYQLPAILRNGFNFLVFLNVYNEFNMWKF